MKRPNSSTFIPDLATSCVSDTVQSSSSNQTDDAAQILLSLSYPYGAKADQELRSRPLKKRRTELEPKPDKAVSSSSGGALVSDDEDESSVEARPARKCLSHKKQQRPAPLCQPRLFGDWRAISRPLPPPPRLPRLATGVIFPRKPSS